jgi:CheY-like chemotaxis protein
MATPQSIVIVEDECIAAEDIRRRLISWGYRVPAVVTTGEEAVASVEQMRPDLVLMDIHLKGRMTGVEAAELIRTRLDVPVIFASAYNDLETMTRVGVEGPFGMVNKPYDDLEIRAAIEFALTKQKLQRTNLERKERPLHSLEGLVGQPEP